MKHLLILSLICFAGCDQNGGMSNNNYNYNKKYDCLDEQRAYNRIRQEGLDDASAQRCVTIAKEMVERDRQLRNSR